MFGKTAVLCAALCLCGSVRADEFRKIPSAWKWTGPSEVVFSYDGSFTDEDAFSVKCPKMKIRKGVKAPERFAESPVRPEGAENLTFSPDSSKVAFTRGGDLYVADVADGTERRLTSDGSQLVLNGYASWVYYEEIFGRPSRYRAFWWSPDSKKIGFYRFDNTAVPMFPIYSPAGQDGTLALTRYPKAGEANPRVRIGIADVSGRSGEDAAPDIVWADFNEEEDQYFGTPFWGADSREFFISREPRIQNTLDLYSVSAEDGSKKHIYHEEYKTWLDWIDGMLFTDKGLYMARSFETGWQQIYFLSYDGRTLRRLTDGPNWRVSLLRVDELSDDVYFTACRDVRERQTLYRAGADGEVKALTDTSLNVSSVKFSPDGKYFVAALSNFTTPVQLRVSRTADAVKNPGSGVTVADMMGEDYSPEKYALPQLIHIYNEGFRLPAYIVYPKNFDPSRKYPVHIDIYGGPDTPMVRDRWIAPTSGSQWWPDHGIIEVTADCRAAGHGGRAGLDMVYRNLNRHEIDDFVAWAKYLRSLPFVDPDRIGVEGFSFGGTMTAMLLFTASEYFRYGIAGGGVYDWALYDTHYTERFMETPETNPEGYAGSRVINHVSEYPVTYGDDFRDGVEPVMLKLTHGTGDDNVHFQNTLQLVDEMQKQGKKFLLMIYPDGKHGYRDLQHRHSLSSDREFWLKYLCRIREK